MLFRSIAALARACEVELTVIGRCTEPGEGLRLLGADGRDHAPARAGFDHFADAGPKAPGPRRRKDPAP